VQQVDYCAFNRHTGSGSDFIRCQSPGYGLRRGATYLPAADLCDDQWGHRYSAYRCRDSDKERQPPTARNARENMYRWLRGFLVDVCGLAHDGRIYALRRLRSHPVCVFLHLDYPYPPLHCGDPFCIADVRSRLDWRLRKAPEISEVYFSTLALRSGFGCGGIPDDFSVLRLKSLPLRLWNAFGFTKPIGNSPLPRKRRCWIN